MSDEFPDLPTVEIDEEIPARRALRSWLAKQPDIYEMRGVLHRWENDADGGAGALVPLDAETLTDYTADRLNTTKKDRSVLLPSRMAKALLRTKGGHFRTVDGVTRWPIPRPDGTIAAARGYDAATRQLIAPAVDVKPVPDYPTARDVETARANLDRLFGGFPYAARADYAATLGLYLSPLLRAFLPASTRSPLGVVRATTPGTGKSYLSAEGLECLYSARRISSDQSARELGKTLIASLEKRTDAAVIAFDNFATGGQVTGAHFARWISEPVLAGRVIGTGRTPEIPNTFQWVVNGNNLRVGGDMARRSLVITLKSDADDPSQVEHPFDFLEELEASRGEVLWSLLTLIRNWTQHPPARRVLKRVKLGQFSQWMTTVRSILCAAGIEGFNENRDEVMAEADEQGQDFGRFYAAWRDLLGGGWTRAAKVCGHRALQDLIPRTDNFRDISHRELGRRVLRPEVGRVRKAEDGRRLAVAERFNRHTKAYEYKIIDLAAALVAKTADAVRSAMDTARERFAKRAQMRRARTFPDVMSEARRRRSQTRRVVRVEPDLFARAAQALDAMAPATS